MYATGVGQMGLSGLSGNPWEGLKGSKWGQFLHFGLLDPQNGLVEGGHENVKTAWGTNKV